MAGHTNKKRRIDSKAQRPTKKQRKIQAYNSDSGNEDAQTFDAVNLLDSDDDIHDTKVDDVGNGNNPFISDEEMPSPKMMTAKAKKAKPKEPKVNSGREDGNNDEEEMGSGLDDDDDDNDDEDDDDDEKELGMELNLAEKKRSKRNDPGAFATSLSKILSTKLSTSKRSDPVLARSAAAHQSSKAAVDNALEAKAKRKLKEQKRIAMEKGRVKDILTPTTNEATDELETSIAEVLEMERKLRKIAQRGVVRLFNAVRTAQVKAADAEKSTRKDGVIGIKSRGEKVNDMSKKGFLELIASGGGGVKP